jgi:hypothetical protein
MRSKTFSLSVAMGYPPALSQVGDAALAGQPKPTGRQ